MSAQNLGLACLTNINSNQQKTFQLKSCSEMQSKLDNGRFRGFLKIVSQLIVQLLVTSPIDGVYS